MIFIAPGFITDVGGIEVVMDHPLAVYISDEMSEGLGERTVEISLLVEPIFDGIHIGVFTDVIRFSYESEPRPDLDIGDGSRGGDVVETKMDGVDIRSFTLAQGERSYYLLEDAIVVKSLCHVCLLLMFDLTHLVTSLVDYDSEAVKTLCYRLDEVGMFAIIVTYYYPGGFHL